MKKIFVLLAFSITFACITFHYSANAYGKYLAKPTSSSVEINGKSISFCAYNINGYNYFKLRDIAMALVDSEKEFDVSFNSNDRGAIRNMVTIFTKERYTNIEYKPVGDELTGYASSEKLATTSEDRIFYSYKAGNPAFDYSNELGFTIYKIDGFNYIRLRDLAYFMDFSVEWDESSDSITVDTQKGYVVQASAPNVTNDNHNPIGEIHRSENPIFIDSMPILSYSAVMQELNIPEEHRLGCIYYPSIKNVYIFAQDLINYSYDVHMSDEENTLYITKNYDRRPHMLPGVLVNAPLNTDKISDLFLNNVNVVLDGKTISSFSDGDKTLISATELLRNSDVKSTYITASGHATDFDFMSFKLKEDLLLKPINESGDGIMELSKGNLSYPNYLEKHFWGQSLNYMKNGYGYYTTNYQPRGTGTTPYWFNGYQKGIYKDNLFMSGISYKSTCLSGSTVQLGYRYEGDTYDGYLRKSVATSGSGVGGNDDKFYFGYRVVCEGEVKDGEFCGFFIAYDKDWKITFQGQYSDYTVDNLQEVLMYESVVTTPKSDNVDFKKVHLLYEGSAFAISKDDKLYTWSGANYRQGGNGPLYARYNVKSASGGIVIALDNKAYEMADFLVDTKDILIGEDVEYYSGMNYIDVNGVLYYTYDFRKGTDGDIITEDVKKVIGGTGIIFLKNDNSAWILRNKDQTAYAYQNYPLTPTKISDDCIDVAMCVERAAFVKTDGTVWAFGKPYIGGTQYENIFNLKDIEPTQIADGGFVEVECGYNFFAAKKSNNSLWVWGANDKYQLGREGEGTLIPEKILDDVISFSCYGEIGLAVKEDGTLWAWGDSGVAWGLSEDEGRDESNKTPRQLFAHEVKTEIKRNETIYNMSSALEYGKP